MTNAVNIAQIGSNNTTFRNRIINGAMVFDQRGVGASITQNTTVQYTLDRWFAYGSVTSKYTIQQNAASVTPPAGYANYLGVTSSSAYSVGSTDLFFIGQYIEGFNFYDLNWGTANAQTITLSFWVRSSLTGTFGGGLQNNAQTRSYPFSYTISAANTWEQKTVTIAGDTSGTWVGATSGVGLKLWISMGMGSTYSGTAGIWGTTDYRSVTGAVSVVGTSGATLYITGVQLEAGSTASPFEYRSYGTELALCQRYYEKSYPIGTVPGAASITAGMSWVMNGYSSSAYVLCTTTFKATKRTAATVAYWDAAGNATRTTTLTGGGLGQVDNNNNIYATAASESGFFIYILGVPSLNNGVQWTASAEL
jgi:hypothetical protein